ncbi:hypothetical protein [Echinicola sp. 20G]|uniref:hypothetical protein n=1 Tax=Echinicola sp. 20G TaxID=2781961 RepID=UPI0019105C62|nr:hypothetical protein [Echinicola sp. 20G]
MYKATHLYTRLLLLPLLLLFTSQWNGYAQTYTYTRTNVGCDGQWGTAACWEITVLDATNCNPTYDYPVINPSSSCESSIIINGDLTYSGNMTLGGGFTSITVNEASTFTITGDLSISGGETVDVYFDGRDSKLEVGQQLTINPSATINVLGPSDLSDEEEISSFVEVHNLFVRGKSKLSVDENAGIIINGTTEAHTPSNDAEDKALIDVDGIFNTKSIYIRGNSHLAFEVTEDAQVRASEPGGTLEMNGNSTLTFIGDYYEAGGDADGESYVDVGGNIDTNGSNAKITADDATIFTCSVFPTNIQKVETNEGEFMEGNCRILPVIWLDFNVSILNHLEKPKLSWSTAKEWENSHFEIERSLNGIDDFLFVGQVNAKGWSNEISSYTFKDPIYYPPSSRLYYRIKQINLDGSSTYSQVISIQSPSSPTKTWMAFPNPTDGNHLSISNPTKSVNLSDPITIKIYTPGHFANFHSVEYEYSPTLNLDNLVQSAPKGLLILEITWNNQTDRIKILNR